MDPALSARLTEVLAGHTPCLLVEQYPRIAERVAQLWGRETLVAFLNDLLFDSRGDRAGFPPDIAHELFMIQREHDKVMGIGSEAAIWGYEEVLRSEALKVQQAQYDVLAYLEAAKQGRVDILHAQLQAGAPVDFLDQDGLTAFWWAAFYGHIEAAELLLQNGAHSNVENHQGLQAVHFFAASDQCSGLNLLLRFGIKLDVTDLHGVTPLMLAAAKGRIAAAVLLLEHGLDPEQLDMAGKSALHYAADGGHRRMIELLLSHGVGAHTPDHGGQTAYEAAMLHPDSNKLKPLFDL